MKRKWIYKWSFCQIIVVPRTFTPMKRLYFLCVLCFICLCLFVFLVCVSCSMFMFLCYLFKIKKSVVTCYLWYTNCTCYLPCSQLFWIIYEQISVELLSINCRVLNDKVKRNEGFHWINNHPRSDFDILIFLQEAHSTFKSENKFQTQLCHDSKKYCTFFSHGSSSSKGIMTVIDQKYKSHITGIEIDAKDLT